MRALLTIALCLATGLAFAQPAMQAGPGSALTGPRPVIDERLRMAKVPQPQKPGAAVALTLTDDADSVMLPAFAMRTTPLPMRFLRLGIEWKF